MNIWRKEFPMLTKTMHGKPLIYLDSAATAQKPKRVIDCLTDFYTNHYGTVHRAVYDLAVHATKAYNEARVLVQRLLNAKEYEEIIFTRGTTESINTVAYSFCKAFLQKGDEILITEMEHHSNIVPWQIACEERGGKLVVVPVLDNGELDLNVFEKLLSDRTKLVAVTHLSNTLGTINPIQTICRLAHKKGAKVLVDGAQAAPRMPVDVQDLECDFYVFSGHKLYGPTGVGVLYGRRDLLEAIPPYQGGGDMIEKVTFAKTTYNLLPMKFEAGTPIIAEAIALGEAVRYLQNIGMDKIASHEQELQDYALSELKKIQGLHILGNASSRLGLVAFHVDGIHHLDIGTLLDLKGIAVRTGHHCTQPLHARFHLAGSTRISFGLYNTKEEVTQFIKALKEVLARLS